MLCCRHGVGSCGVTALTKNRLVGPYSRPDALAKLDGRTREARLMEKTRAELIAHVGGAPSITQRLLIDRAAALALQIALFDTKRGEGSFTDHDSRVYLAWTNTLTRLMRQIGAHGVAARKPTLAEHLARRAAEAAA